MGNKPNIIFIKNLVLSGKTWYTVNRQRKEVNKYAAKNFTTLKRELLYLR